MPDDFNALLAALNEGLVVTEHDWRSIEAILQEASERASFELPAAEQQEVENWFAFTICSRMAKVRSGH